jgi:hypothetical protein
MVSFKFRVWDNEGKHMHYMPAAELYEELFLRADGVLCYVLDGSELSDPVPVNDRYEVSFSTGLLDCDGGNIYEGDVVEFRAFGRYLIQFEDGAFRTECLETQALEMFMFNTCLLIGGVNGDGRCTSAKVIGNKFENPELLGVKNDL